MGFSSSPDEGDALKSEINVTPLVDVMLVLLVIFMVTAPMMQQGVEVQLPKATTAPLKGNTEQIVLSIDKNGKSYLGANNEVSLADLPVKAKALMETRPENERKIYIKGDSGANYGDIMNVMGKLHEAGIFQIGLISGMPDGDSRKK
jgi:biopolymer transport protein TolR